MNNSRRELEKEVKRAREECATSQSEEECSTRVDVRPPVQIHIHECPKCEGASVQTSKGELEISQAELERSQCDCQSSHPGKRNTTSVPPSVRRLVMARARHQCQRAGCSHARFLEVHHIVPRSMGGSNDSDNCICLCSACHGLYHKQKIGMASFVVKSQAEDDRWKANDDSSLSG